MNAITNFKKFIAESEDEAAELRSMGFKPDLDFNTRLNNAIKEWDSDPEVQAAMQTFVEKAEQLLTKHGIYFDDPDDVEDWEDYIEAIYNNRIDEVGWFDFIAINNI